MGSLATSFGNLSILPVEIRTKVYSYLLVAKVVDVSEEGQLEFHPAILAVNKTISGEAAPSFRSNNFIKFKFPKNGDEGEFMKSWFPLIESEDEYYSDLPWIITYYHNPLFLYTLPTQQATAHTMRHHIMTIELTTPRLQGSKCEGLISMPMKPEEEEAQDLAELTQIIFPFSELHHLTHHLSSMALGKMMYTASYLRLEIGQHYAGTISNETALQLLQPAYVMLGERPTHIVAAPHVDDTIRQLAWSHEHIASSNATKRHHALIEWLARNQVLVEEADSLWQKKLWDEAYDVAAYTSMVLGAAQITYLQSMPRIPGQVHPDLFGILNDGDREPLWPCRKKLEALWAKCRRILVAQQVAWHKIKDEKKAEEERKKAEEDKETKDGKMATLTAMLLGLEL